MIGFSNNALGIGAFVVGVFLIENPLLTEYSDFQQKGLGIKMTVSKQKAKNRSVKFALKATDAKEVYLVGDFNNWNVGAHHMKNNGKGIWTKTVLLPEGEFGYKFFVDNQWLIDPQNERVCLNCFGSYNNIVRVNG